jgi:hypothetical protein
VQLPLVPLNKVEEVAEHKPVSAILQVVALIELLQAVPVQQEPTSQVIQLECDSDTANKEALVATQVFDVLFQQVPEVQAVQTPLATVYLYSLSET